MLQQFLLILNLQIKSAQFLLVISFLHTEPLPLNFLQLHRFIYLLMPLRVRLAQAGHVRHELLMVAVRVLPGDLEPLLREKRFQFLNQEEFTFLIDFVGAEVHAMKRN